MRLGIDFDNTLVCYDELFHRIARKMGLLDDSVPARKEAVRDYLRSVGKEEDWIHLQGLVYGSRIREATPFPNALEVIRSLRETDIELFIVSHKTKHPYRGPKHDLHEAARGWLNHYGFFTDLKFAESEVFFEETKAGKIERIRELNCNYFLDDLPEFLLEPAFPETVSRVLFDPADSAAIDPRYKKIRSWLDLTSVLK